MSKASKLAKVELAEAKAGKKDKETKRDIGVDLGKSGGVGIDVAMKGGKPVAKKSKGC